MRHQSNNAHLCLYEFGSKFKYVKYTKTKKYAYDRLVTLIARISVVE